MTDAINLTTLCTTIAAQTISITGAYGSAANLSIRDISNVPVAVNQQDCPLLAPAPNGFVSNVVITRDTYGADASLKRIEYDLRYRFYYAPMLQSVSMFEKYDEMVTAAVAVLLHFSTNTNLSGSTDFLPQSLPGFGPVTDGTLNSSGQPTIFHGCDFVFHVMQYLET